MDQMVSLAKEEPRRTPSELRLDLVKLGGKWQRRTVPKAPADYVGTGAKVDGQTYLSNQAKANGSSICDDVKGSLAVAKQVRVTVKNGPWQPPGAEGIPGGARKMSGMKSHAGTSKNAGGKNGKVGGGKPKLVVRRSPKKRIPSKTTGGRTSKAPAKSSSSNLPKGPKEGVGSKKMEKSSAENSVILIKHYPFCNICGLGNPLSPPVKTFVVIGDRHQRNRFVCQTCHKRCTLTETKRHHETCYLTYGEVYFGVDGDEEPGMKNGKTKFRMVACDKCALLLKLV